MPAADVPKSVISIQQNIVSAAQKNAGNVKQNAVKWQLDKFIEGFESSKPSIFFSNYVR